MMIALSPCLTIAAGKPDKHNPSCRKAQMGGKGDYGNCFFYAAKLATDWGPIPAEHLEHYRYLSLHRKKITEYTNGVWYKRQTVINVVKAIANALVKALNPTQETKQWIIGELPNILAIIRDQKAIRQGTDQVAQEFISQFSHSSHVDLESFAADLVYKERIANHLLFLCQTIPQFKDVLNTKIWERQARQQLPAGNWGDFSSQNQYRLLHELFLEQASIIFNFEATPWNPLKSVKVLKTLLETKGPLIANGRLGKGNAMTAPVLCKTDRLYDYYHWDPTHYQSTKGIKGHVVVIIKVEEEPEASVSFLDPFDGSQLGQNRKVYMLPYQIFCQNVYPTSGIRVSMELDHYLWYRKSAT